MFKQVFCISIVAPVLTGSNVSDFVFLLTLYLQSEYISLANHSITCITVLHVVKRSSFVCVGLLTAHFGTGLVFFLCYPIFLFLFGCFNAADSFTQ